jgi:hypothetical protein
MTTGIVGLRVVPVAILFEASPRNIVEAVRWYRSA